MAFRPTARLRQRFPSSRPPILHPFANFLLPQLLSFCDPLPHLRFYFLFNFFLPVTSFCNVDSALGPFVMEEGGGGAGRSIAEEGASMRLCGWAEHSRKQCLPWQVPQTVLSLGLPQIHPNRQKVTREGSGDPHCNPGHMGARAAREHRK